MEINTIQYNTIQYNVVLKQCFDNNDKDFYITFLVIPTFKDYERILKDAKANIELAKKNDPQSKIMAHNRELDAILSVDINSINFYIGKYQQIPENYKDAVQRKLIKKPESQKIDWYSIIADAWAMIMGGGLLDMAALEISLNLKLYKNWSEHVTEDDAALAKEKIEKYKGIILSAAERKDTFLNALGEDKKLFSDEEELSLNKVKKFIDLVEGNNKSPKEQYETLRLYYINFQKNNSKWMMDFMGNDEKASKIAEIALEKMKGDILKYNPSKSEKAIVKIINEKLNSILAQLKERKLLYTVVLIQIAKLPEAKLNFDLDEVKKNPKDKEQTWIHRIKQYIVADAEITFRFYENFSQVIKFGHQKGQFNIGLSMYSGALNGDIQECFKNSLGMLLDTTRLILGDVDQQKNSEFDKIFEQHNKKYEYDIMSAPHMRNQNECERNPYVYDLICGLMQTKHRDAVSKSQSKQSAGASCRM
ncbi:MAG: hypothetical protein O3C05_00755 [Proteobacteria bacterium]|nr:hypothetical protein [Pseudomonadota bacterium]